MPIQIIDNFELTSAKPIDNRLVVGPNSFYTNKDDITNKYNGLRIWELPGSNIGGGLTNSTPSGVSYVWTGSAWISENTTGISGGGDSGRVPYFNSSNSIQSSNIYYNGTNVGIGISAETGLGSSKLVVDGSIKSNGGYFIGNAWDSSTSTGLSNLNATNLSLGTIPIGRFPTSTVGWILTADSTAASYKDPSSITVGTASALQTTRTIWGQSFNGTGNVTGNILGAGTIQFGSQTNKATISYNVNSTRTLTVPTLSSNSTFAFLEQSQTWTGDQNFSSKVRVVKTGTASFTIENTLNNINIQIDSFSNTTGLYLKNPSNTTYTSSIQQFSNYSVFNGNGLTYFLVNDEGNRQLLFGRPGSNSQIYFLMDNSSINLPRVGGKGVNITYNLNVNGNISIGSLPTSSSGLSTGTLYTQTALQLGGLGSTKVLCVA